MSLDEIREKHAAGNETAAEAFHELCSMVEAIEVTLFILIELFEDMMFNRRSLTTILQVD